MKNSIDYQAKLIYMPTFHIPGVDGLIYNIHMIKYGLQMGNIANPIFIEILCHPMSFES